MTEIKQRVFKCTNPNCNFITDYPLGLDNYGRLDSQGKPIKRAYAKPTCPNCYPFAILMNEITENKDE